MGSKGLALAIVFMVIGLGSSDFEQERTECANQLVALASCLSYVGGNAKAPTLDCCTGLKTVLQKSKKCLCILIKERDNPNLGFKLNATLAATLPSACNAPANITQCIDILHLAPSSPDAKVFEGFASLTHGGTKPNVANGNSSTSAEVESDGGMANKSRWISMEMIICGIFMWVLTILVI